MARVTLHFCVWGTTGLLLLTGSLYLTTSRSALGRYHHVSGCTSPTAFGLLIEPQFLELGDTLEDSRFGWPITIKNTTSNDIRIESFETACDCVAIEPSALTIAANTSAEIVLTVDLTATKGIARQPTARFKTSFRAVVTTDGENLVLDRWELYATVRRVLESPPRVIDFGTHSHRRHPIPARTVRLKAVVPVQTIVPQCKSDWILVDIHPVIGEPGVFDIRVAPQGRLELGSYQFDLGLVVELACGRTLTLRRIPVHCEVAADVHAIPPRVCLGSIKCPDGIEDFITFCSLTHSPFKVTSYRTVGDGLSVVPSPHVRSLGQPAYHLTQRVLRPGKFANTVIFTIEHFDGTLTELRVPVEFHAYTLELGRGE